MIVWSPPSSTTETARLVQLTQTPPSLRKNAQFGRGELATSPLRPTCSSLRPDMFSLSLRTTYTVRRNWWAKAAFALVLFGSNWAAAQLPAAPAKEVAVSERARELFSVGVALLQDPDGARYEQAFRSFLKAYEESPSWKILGNLGLCALKLERYTDGIEAYERYLATATEPLDPSEKSQVERDLRIMKGTSGTLVVRVVGATTEKIVDRRERAVGGPVTNSYVVPTSGTLKLKVAGGTHTLTATSEGKTVEAVAEVEVGRTSEATLDFSELQPALATGPRRQRTPQDDRINDSATINSESTPSGTGMRTTGYIVGGVGVAALIGGGVTTIMGLGLSSDMDDRCPDGRCEYFDADQKKDFEDDKQQMETLGTMTTALYIGGGVLAATGVTLWILGGKNSDERVALQVTPSVGLGLSGFVAEGRF